VQVLIDKVAAFKAPKAQAPPAQVVAVTPTNNARVWNMFPFSRV
jgi:hypothetical protein